MNSIFFRVATEIEQTMGQRKVTKLKGRANYDTWFVAARAYLALEGHWNCVLGEETDSTKNMLACSALLMLIEDYNYSYIQECTMAKDAWDILEAAFKDSGICRRVDMLKHLISLKLNECESMEDYINQMTTTTLKISKSGLKIDDEIIASLMLAGLPDDYRPMVMAIENSSEKLSTDKIKTRLLQEVNYEKSNNGASALVAKSKTKSKVNIKTVKCFECNEIGHYARKCPKKKSKKRRFVDCNTIIIVRRKSRKFQPVVHRFGCFDAHDNVR